jgi:hypothetical protein
LESRTLAYFITIFNQIPLSRPFDRELLDFLQRANFTSLGLEYGIDPGLIQSAKSNLDVLTDEVGKMNLLLVRYWPASRSPVVIYRKEFKDLGTIEGNNDANFPEKCKGLKEKLLQAKVLYEIELEKNQLTDMGLLIGYECARWLAFHGKGLVRDLHGYWYRMNEQQAFIPFN